MRAGIVFADVLGHDTAAGKALSLVFLLRVLAGDTDVGFEE